MLPNKRNRLMEKPGLVNISKFLTKAGASVFSHPNFESGHENFDFLQHLCKVLVIGAGGLGCEILKNLCCLGFHNIDVIDMDTIELSNLNRQFLFREEDIGKSKAMIAAAFFKYNKAWCNITPHFCKIQDYGPEFYQNYHIIICGLDSIIARRWINNMILSLLKYNEDGELDSSSIIPLIDGGTEGFKGNSRVILPGISACIDCMLDLYPPQVNFPLCTIANRPRLPEHCIEYIRLVLWDKLNPFGDIEIDGDNPDHIKWIFEESKKRAAEYNIPGITFSLTQGVVKRLVPAVASTNAVIAASCVNEAFKIATNCYLPISNFLFNDTDGVYCYNYTTDKKIDCIACGRETFDIEVSMEDTLNKILIYLKENPNLQMKSPSIFATINGKNRTLYVENVKDLEAKTRHNLTKSLKELMLMPNSLIEVTDVTTPNIHNFRLKII